LSLTLALTLNPNLGAQLEHADEIVRAHARSLEQTPQPAAVARVPLLLRLRARQHRQLLDALLVRVRVGVGVRVGVRVRVTVRVGVRVGVRVRVRVRVRVTVRVRVRVRVGALLECEEHLLHAQPLARLGRGGVGLLVEREM